MQSAEPHRTAGFRAAQSALLAGAIAVATAILPASASALATSVVSASIPGPNAAMTGGDSPVACGARLVSGGGARVDQPVLSNGTHLAGFFPTTDGSSPSADGDHNPVAWIGSGSIGGQATSNVTTWGYGICFDSGPSGTIVVQKTVPGPDQTFTGVAATATCPAGTRLVGGGAQTTPGTVGSLKPNGSFPSDATGAPVLGGANPTSWTATGLNGGQPPAGNTTHVFAICATDPNLTVAVVNSRVDGPGPASTPAQVTTSCPAGTVLLGGGGYISDHFALPGSQGDHLTGSYPSDSGGTPITAGAAASWTASSHTGGTISGDLTDTNVWAMCGSESASGAASVVTGKAGPITGGVTTSQILQAFRRGMVPLGTSAAIPVLLRKSGAKLLIKMPDAGTLKISWSTVPLTTRRGHKTKPVLIAQGSKVFHASGEQPVNVWLTTAGRRKLRASKRIRLIATGTFTRKGKKPITGTKPFVLTHRAATSDP
jgi:hypothetical protein